MHNKQCYGLIETNLYFILSDGVGRTGAFITIYSQLERAKVEGVADIFQFVKSIRLQRAGMVSNLVSQYKIP